MGPKGVPDTKTYKPVSHINSTWQNML
jgi:hypothetical protein